MSAVREQLGGFAPSDGEVAGAVSASAACKRFRAQFSEALGDADDEEEEGEGDGDLKVVGAKSTGNSLNCPILVTRLEDPVRRCPACVCSCGCLRPSVCARVFVSLCHCVCSKRCGHRYSRAGIMHLLKRKSPVSCPVSGPPPSMLSPLSCAL